MSRSSQAPVADNPREQPYEPPGAPRRDRRDRPSLWVRVGVHWKRRDLDAALADGANPAKSAELALRAQQLAEPATRAAIAAGIENLFRLATEGPGAPRNDGDVPRSLRSEPCRRQPGGPGCLGPEIARRGPAHRVRAGDGLDPAR